MSYTNFCNTSFKQLVSGFLVVLGNNFAIHHSTTSRESVSDVREVLKYHKPVIITNTPDKPCYFFIHTARNILHRPCTFKNTIILFVSPPKFCIEMCFHFLHLQWSQGKIKTMLMQNSGGQTKECYDIFESVTFSVKCIKFAPNITDHISQFS